MLKNKALLLSAAMRFSALSLVLGLTACGGSNDSSNDNDVEEFVTTFTLNISDAPVDEASEVVVYFDEVELIGNGEPVEIDVTDANGDALRVDLLTLQGGNFISLFSADIPSGDYSQIRLEIEDESYIVMEDGTYPLTVPGDELKLNGFVAQAGSEQTYTVEFDLRRSLVEPVGRNEIFLKPRGVRLVENNSVGEIQGEVSETILTQPACAIKLDYARGNAVYVFEGTDLDPTRLGDDADSVANDEEIRPFTSANVVYTDTEDTYTYSMGYLPQGDYTVALSCLALNDEPETDEDDGFEFLVVEEVSVTARQTSTVNFIN